MLGGSVPQKDRRAKSFNVAEFSRSFYRGTKVRSGRVAGTPTLCRQ